MSRQPWWGYVRNILRAYPNYCKELEQIKSQVITTNYNATGGGSGPSMPTERLALKKLPGDKQKRYDAVTAALKKTRRLPDGKRCCQMIEMVYFRKTHTLEGAAIACNISYATAKRWHQKFIWTVKDGLGIL